MDWIVFVIGLIVGSFLNVVTIRFGTQTSSLVGRSACPHCHRALTWLDLVPIVSFLMLRGRCRSCQISIHWRYPFVELFTGLVTGALWVVLPMPINLLSILAAWILIALMVIDLEHMVLPDRGLVFLACVVLVMYAVDPTTASPRLAAALLGALVGVVLPLILILVSKGQGMGIGDLKFSAILGLWIGWPGVLVMWFVAVMSGAIIGIFLMLTGLRRRTDAIPFGPFLVIGLVVAMIWGSDLWRWLLA